MEESKARVEEVVEQPIDHCTSNTREELKEEETRPPRIRQVPRFEEEVEIA